MTKQEIIRTANAVAEVMDFQDYLSPMYYKLDAIFRDCLSSLTDYYGMTRDELCWEVHCPE